MAVTKKYIAIAPLFIGRARAANPGDEVPGENVEAHGWGDLVEVIEIHDDQELEATETTEPPADGEQLGELEESADAQPIPPAEGEGDAGESAETAEPAAEEPPAEELPATTSRSRGKNKA